MNSFFNRRSSRGVAFVGAGLTVAFWMSTAAAQAPLASAAIDNGDKLEEIIVTAQKRSENLQEVPISVEVIRGSVLAEQNHNSLEDLTEVTPSVHAITGAFANSLYIRGIGSDQNPGFEQSAAIFSDDIYHGRSRMSEGTFLDLDRIE